MTGREYLAKGKGMATMSWAKKLKSKLKPKKPALAYKKTAKDMGVKKKSLTQDQPEGEVMIKSFAEFFETDVEKGMKKKGKGVAAKIGNEMNPVRGSQPGSFVKKKGVSSAGGGAERDHAKKPHAPRSGVVKSFPSFDSVSVVEYTALPDMVLSKQLEENSLITPSLRNLEMERATPDSDEE
jgi:hypothetical protein